MLVRVLLPETEGRRNVAQYALLSHYKSWSPESVLPSKGHILRFQPPEGSMPEGTSMITGEVDNIVHEFSNIFYQDRHLVTITLRNISVETR